MDNNKFVIMGGRKIIGKVAANGSKNGAFPILAATILLSEKITVSNIPDIIDIGVFKKILIDLGAVVIEYKGGELLIDSSSLNKFEIDRELGGKIRGSYYFLGSLLAKYGQVSFPQPGGCNIGDRPMDLHISTFEKLGVRFKENDGYLEASKFNIPNQKITIDLPFPSRGVTINVILFSSIQENFQITINNANQSPETLSLIDFINYAGGNIIIEEHQIKITGVKKLKLKSFRNMSDKIEIATLLVAGLITNGKVMVNNIDLNYISEITDIFESMHIRYKLKGNSISVKSSRTNEYSGILISGLTPPMIDADFEPIFTPLLALSCKNSLIEDTINNGRHNNFIPFLNLMGAKIHQLSTTRALVKAGGRFSGQNVISKDIRSGVSLLLAALVAEGETIISNIHQIDRGYHNLDGKLISLGANIRRI